MAEVADKFNYVYSCDLNENVQIKIGTLEGQRERPSYIDLLNDPMLKFSGACCNGCSDLYVTCQVFSDGKPLALPTQTSYKAFSTRWNWNEWLTLPVKYSDLPRNAVLGLTIWDIYGTNQAVPVGSTTITLFGKHGTFRQGMHDLKVWLEVLPDPNNPSSTPGKTKDNNDQMNRLSKLSKKHRDGHMVKKDWLDRLTFREIEMINERQKRDSNYMYLMIEFPYIHDKDIKFAVIYFEKDADNPYQFLTHADIVTVPDPEIQLENLVENKHHKLARSLRSGPTDRDMKPDAKTRDFLNVIVGYPPTKVLTSEEQDLVWKFRFYLSFQKKALTKFLKCVNWSLPQEVKQALEMLNRWNPMDVEDALELLSPAFTHPSVRKYAVSRLRQASDEHKIGYTWWPVLMVEEEPGKTPERTTDPQEATGKLSHILEELSVKYNMDNYCASEDLLLYLLQLVQALRYEDPEAVKTDLDNTNSHRDSAVIVDDITGLNDKERTFSILTRAGSHDSILDALGGSPKLEESAEVKLEKEMDLATYLISRASCNSTLANYFYWYLVVEVEDQEMDKTKNIYYTVFKRFSHVLSKGGSECRQRRSTLVRQQLFMEKLVNLVKIIARESGNRKKKIEKLQALLQDAEVCKINFSDFEPLPLPLDPDVKVKGIDPEKATIFKSNLMPSKLSFITTDNTPYVTIFKHGDDLRQDQLILQMITLMDKLLGRENLDLKLTPYKVLATSSKHGFVQFIQSSAVAEVLESEGSIQNYFRKHAPSENSPYGISPEVMDNYIKSCAGYCVVTYLLGVGDRHLDNLLLTKTGKLFHIDFGYILGRDPKPLPPPMKLSKEMVEAMGGTTSEHFKDFRTHCYTAFLAIRRSANLILNLFSLMVDASIPDIALEPDKTVKKLQDKFVLHLSDEEAVAYIQNILDESVSATMAALVEQFHKMAQYWRR